MIRSKLRAKKNIQAKKNVSSIIRMFFGIDTIGEYIEFSNLLEIRELRKRKTTFFC